PIVRVLIGDNTAARTFDYVYDNEVVTSEDSTPPSTPTGVTVTGATQSSISLGWNASTDDIGVAGYHVYRNNAALDETTATNYTFAGLSCGTTYTVGVDAFDAAGNVSGCTSITAATSACAGYLRVLDSTNSRPVGLSEDSNNCTLARTELGDTLAILPASTRCTWT